MGRSREDDTSYRRFDGPWRPDTPRFRAGNRTPEPWVCECGTRLPGYRVNCLDCGARRPPPAPRSVHLVNLASHEEHSRDWEL